MIENVCVSHKIVKHRVLLRGADRGGYSVVCDGPYCCLADYMPRNYYQTWSKPVETCMKFFWVFSDLHTVFAWLTHNCDI